MSISCECGGNYDWQYIPDDDYSEMIKYPCRRRCTNCHTQIEPGDTVLTLFCFRPPAHELEENIYGDEVPMANKYLCESCADLFFSLSELGYCITFHEGENFVETWKELSKSNAV